MFMYTLYLALIGLRSRASLQCFAVDSAGSEKREEDEDEEAYEHQGGVGSSEDKTFKLVSH